MTIQTEPPPIMTPVQECERLLLHLHDIMKAGGKSDEADSIRDEMDSVWRNLSASEKDQVGQLSEDLYLLEGKYIADPEDPEPDLSPVSRAYTFYVKWERQGFYDAAKRFEAFWLSAL